MTSLLSNPWRRVLRFVKSAQPGETPEKLPAASNAFYQLSSRLASGQPFAFAALQGKPVLLVNTRLDPATSPQYQELQQLAAQFAGELVVLLFPSADFAEPGAATAAAPAAVSAAAPATLLQMQPGVVTKSARQNPVYQWLSAARQNGWNEQAPPRPFAKYLVDATGQLAHYFGPTLSPLSETITDRIRSAAAE